MNRDPELTAAARTRELEREGSTHPSIEQLALLLEDPAAAPSEEARLRAHLTECRRCFGIYAELAETTLAWRWGKESEARVPGDLLEEARAMRPLRGAGHRIARSMRRRMIVAAGVAAVVVAAMLVVVRSPSLFGNRRIHADAEVVGAVRQAVAQASRTGMILTADIAPAAPPHRSIGAAGPSPRLAESIEELVKLHDRSDAGEDVAFWLVTGMLADGDPGARTILEESRTRFPRSRRLVNLEAVIAYRENRLADSERTLTALVREDPRDPVALFNLSLLLRETGREREAREIEARLLALLPGEAPLRARIPPDPDRPGSIVR